MKHVLKVFSLLVAVLLMSFGSTHAAYNMQEYYPLSEGNSWTYLEVSVETEDGEAENSADTYTRIVSGTENVNGVSTIKVGEWISGQEYWYTNLAWGAQGLAVYREYEVEPSWNGGTPEIEEDRYLTPLVYLPSVMEIGEPISHNISAEWYENGELNDYEEGILTVTIEGIETITVEAGTFEQCLKIHGELETILYDQQGGTALGSCIEHSYSWLAPGIGEIKEIWTETDYDSSGEVVETETGIEELRWATISGTTIGTGGQVWNGIDFSHAGAIFNESTMNLHDVFNEDLRFSGLTFRLDLDNVFYVFEPWGYHPVSIPGLDFTNAYIKMNGGCLYIYNIDIYGVKYWTRWNAEIDPVIGFSFIDLGLM